MSDHRPDLEALAALLAVVICTLWLGYVIWITWLRAAEPRFDLTDKSKQRIEAEHDY